MKNYCRSKLRSGCGISSKIRSGVATIELVLFFPILVWLSAMIFSLGFVHLQKSSTIIQSRHKAWAVRPPQGNDRESFADRVLIRGETGANKVERDFERNARRPNIPGLTNAGGLVTTKTEHSLIMDTWTDDNRRVGLRDPVNRVTLHTVPLQSLLAPTGIPGATISAITVPTDSLISTIQLQAATATPSRIKLLTNGPQMLAAYFQSMEYYFESGAAIAFFDYNLPPQGVTLSQSAFEQRVLPDLY